MKIISASLILVFSFHLVEITPALLRPRIPNPKTCCGRPVCLCTHPKGVPCPFKKSLLGNFASHHSETRGHKFCHLRNHVDLETEVETKRPKTNEEPLAGTFFKRAPCDPENSKSAIPSYSEDFYLENSGQSPGMSFEPEPSFMISAAFHATLFDHSLDKPPRIPLLS